MNYYYVQGGNMNTNLYKTPATEPDGRSPQTAYYYIQEAINQIFLDGSVDNVGN